jgi:hypothetical protein
MALFMWFRPSQCTSKNSSNSRGQTTVIIHTSLKNFSLCDVLRQNSRAVRGRQLAELIRSVAGKGEESRAVLSPPKAQIRLSGIGV